jgi:hypothetical protein
MHALVCLVLVGTCLASMLLALRASPLMRSAVAVSEALPPLRVATSTRVILTAPKTSPPV